MASLIDPPATSSPHDGSHDLSIENPHESHYFFDDDDRKQMDRMFLLQTISIGDNVSAKQMEQYKLLLRETYPQYIGKTVTAQWYFEIFLRAHLQRRYGSTELFKIPTASDPNCQRLYENILAGEKDDYGIVRIEPYQTNEEIEAWRWNHSRLLQEHHNIFEDVHEYMKRSGIGLSLNNTSEKEKEKKATGNNGVEEEERNEEVDVHMEWIRIELFVFQIIWHIAKDDKFPDVIQVDENSDVFFFLKSFALDLRCQIEKYFKIFECKEIEIEIPTELNCDNEKK